ncbi:MAG: GLPGLI family protein [Bacteroidota bacterium]
MKRTASTCLILFLALLTALPSVAQEGTVIYKETRKLEIELPPEMAHMAEQFPSERTANYQLLFNDVASLMQSAPEAEEEENEAIELANGDGTVQIRFGGADQNEDATYINFDEQQSIEKKDFLGRTFLITGDAHTLPWRLTGERSEFLGYVAQKAVAMRDTVAIEAWFTPEIPVPAGPNSYGGLPGLILVLTVDDGRTSYVAEEVTLAALEEPIEAPKKGRKVSSAEFKEIVAEKMKEMQSGGTGTFIIQQQ